MPQASPKRCAVKLKRITLAGTLALAAILLPALTAAQSSATIARVAYLGSGAAPTPATPNLSLQAFRRGLGELGYVEGRDVVIETRWAEGRIDQLPVLAAELVGLKVDAIVAVGASTVRAAKNATTTIPIVMAVVVDPVEAGLVANLERPGGNLGLHGVDRYRHSELAGCGQDRRQSPDFFLHRHRHCRAVRASRFRADIQNVGTFSNHSTGVVEGAGWIDELSAIRE